MHRPDLITLFREDIATYTATSDLEDARRYWVRALIETMNLRSLTSERPPAVKGDARVDRFGPFWNSRTDEELDHLRRYLRAYYRRPENREKTL